jgi:uncharacterized protein (TIGR00369 family)
MSEGEKQIWQKPPKGDYPDPAIFGLSGLELMRAARRLQGWPIPPMSYLIGMHWHDVSAGTTTFSIPASPWFCNATGLIPGGMLAVLADVALPASIHTELPPATGYASAELSVTFLRPVSPEPETRIVGSGQVIHCGRSVGLSEGFLINDRSDELVAHATTRVAVFGIDPPPKPPEEMPAFDIAIPGESPDDPINQELRGEVLPQEQFERRSGHELLDAWIAGELPPPPIFYLCGLAITEAGDGEATMTLPCSPWVSSGFRTVLGGFTAMLAEATLAAAVFSTTPAGTAVAPLDLKVNFLRPVFPDGRRLTEKAELIHRGRTLAVASCRVENADGKPVALATGSAMYLPGRPANLAGIDQLAASGEEG